MSFDTKYRPPTFDAVLGQEGTIKILRQFIRLGKGRQQSYLFAGPFGSGKTTLGRILSRALLCSSPTEIGDPCDKCVSCLSLLKLGVAEGYVEVDAATNSGKDHIRKIVEEIQFSTFSDRHRIYLFDECFTADTLLQTPDGLKSIQSLVEMQYSGTVLTVDPVSKQHVWTPVSNWFDHGERATLTLTFDSGVILTVTESQLIFTENRGWVPAKDLTNEDDVVESSLVW